MGSGGLESRKRRRLVQEVREGLGKQCFRSQRTRVFIDKRNHVDKILQNGPKGKKLRRMIR